MHIPKPVLAQQILFLHRLKNIFKYLILHKSYMRPVQSVIYAFLQKILSRKHFFHCAPKNISYFDLKSEDNLNYFEEWPKNHVLIIIDTNNI